MSINYIYTLCIFRCESHRLPVETGRWQNLSRSDRLCHPCDSTDIGGEYHYIMSCSALKQERKRFLPDYCNIRLNTYKYSQLFKSTDTVVLEKLCRFIKIVNVKVSPPV